MAPPRPAPLRVTVVSSNVETLERLLAYLEESGAPARGERSIDALKAIATGTTAVVLFPDDYDADGVTAALLELRRLRPRVLIVVVTRTPRRFQAALAPDGRSLPPLLMPKASFGWSILDAIRAHAHSRAKGQS